MVKLLPKIIPAKKKSLIYCCEMWMFFHVLVMMRVGLEPKKVLEGAC